MSETKQPTDAELVEACAAFMGWRLAPWPNAASSRKAWVDEYSNFMGNPGGDCAFNPLTRPADWAMLLARLRELREFGCLTYWDGTDNYSFEIGGVHKAQDTDPARAIVDAIYAYQQAQK